ncbi:MAG: zf-TFIIB domain-containing protein [Fuerstiella sp.]|nr:zf-TFIIB domain-containing protein [Fuerstiella sp.]
MKCPLDGHELARQRYEADIDIDKCSECGGVWLDHQELERLQDTREHDYSDEIKQLPNLVDQAYVMALARSKPTVQCPSCDQEMERREYGSCSQVMIDVCPTCRGIWLDNGEISALEIFFERARSETAEIRSGFFAGLMDFFD